MSYKLEDIKYETKDFFVIARGDKGFEVCQTGICHATRRAIVSKNMGLDFAKRHADKMQEVKNNHKT